MKIRGILLAAIILISAAALPAYAAGGGTGTAVYKNTSELLAGYTYTNEISFNSLGNREEAFMLSVSPDSEVYPVFMPCENVFGGMTLTKAIEYYESLGKTVVGGVNSDFFAIKNQMPLGISIENGIFKSSPEDENVFAIGEDGPFFTGKTDIKLTLTVDKQDGKDHHVSFKHFNKARNDGGGLYLLTEDFSDTTHTSTDGWAVRFKVVDGEYKLGSTVTYEVESVLPEGKNYWIGEGKAVLTCDATSNRESVLEMFSQGDRVTLSFACSDERLLGVSQAMGCGDLLIEDGQITDSSNWDEAIQSTNPRTAIGVKADGTIVIYALDGKVSGHSTGANMLNLAKDMRSKGVKFAVNLDGGGSTTFAVKKPGDKTATLTNRPSGGAERSCGAFILLVTDSESTNKPTGLHLNGDGIYILRGSSMELSYIATDGKLNETGLSEDVSAASSGLGTVKGSVYTAGMTAGDDTIELTTASGLRGYGTVHIVSESDVSFTLLDSVTGKEPTLTDLEEGAETSLTASMTRYSRPVYIDKSLVKYAVSSTVGTVSDDGIYTVTGLPGRSGSLKVTIGEVTKSYATSVYCTFSDMKSHWASGYVESLYREGIVNGTGSGTFLPENNIKRGDFVLMLWRAMGSPEPGLASAFSDVPSEAYYAKAINWASEQGIAKGSGDGTFAPAGTLTREQAFSLVYRAFFEGNGGEDTAVLEAFADAASVSGYAKEATAGLVSRGIISGSGGKLNPKSTITRAEMAKILCESIYYDYSAVISVG